MKKTISPVITAIKEEYKFIIFLFLLFIILQIPVNYYIVTGGGTSNIESRIEVENKNKSKGSFNISYVTELKGNIITYLLSYIVPTWDRENASDYQYTQNESIKDIEFRGDLDLKTANGNATYWAYTLANQEIEETARKMYVIVIFDGYETPLKIGDQILSMDGNSYDTVVEYRNYLQTKQKGDKVRISIIRNKKEKEITATLYEEDSRRILGVGLQFVKEYKTNPDVKIQFKKTESGPSGGLITTLEIYNQLTKKDITKGLKIVGTGTIEEDGSIGAIGGVTYKLLGAASAKADIFLVPEDNYKEAKTYQKEKNLKIKIVKIKNIEEALEKLEKLK